MECAWLSPVFLVLQEGFHPPGRPFVFVYSVTQALVACNHFEDQSFTVWATIFFTASICAIIASTCARARSYLASSKAARSSGAKKNLFCFMFSMFSPNKKPRSVEFQGFEYRMVFYTIQCPESLPSQIVHRTTLPAKLGCGKRWVTLRFNIVLLYMIIYYRSTESGRQKSPRRSFFGSLLMIS